MVRFVSRSARGVSLLSCSMVLVALTAFGQGSPPDNTKVNTRDRAKSQPTADQQQNGRTDVAITRDIRRALVGDKTLSIDAHNVKIITQHGEVTLKGPVRTADEKKIVEAKATEVAGAGHVKSEIAIKSAPSKKTKVKR